MSWSDSQFNLKCGHIRINVGQTNGEKHTVDVSISICTGERLVLYILYISNMIE